MGSLTCSTKWIPEDDLLLKNAVEAGASLESLAKGAVHFSRRFTVRELKERWRSLLYDSDTSSQASSRIIEIEMGLSVSNPPKGNRNYNSKGKGYSSGKRKEDSLRRNYYSMRKKVCKPCSSSNLGSLMPSPCIPTDSACSCGDQLEPQRKDKHTRFATREQMTNHYGQFGMAYESGDHVLSDLLRIDSTAADDKVSHHIDHTGHVGSVEKKPPNGAVGNECLYGYAEDIFSMSVEKAGGNNTEQSFRHSCAQKTFPEVHGEDAVSLKTCPDIKETGRHQSFDKGNLYENDDLVAKPISFDSTNDNTEHSPCFVTNHNLTSQAADHSDSFHQLGYSSAPPELPIWRTTEGVPQPSTPIDGHFEEREQEALIKKTDSVGCDGTTSESKFKDGMPSDILNDAAIISDSDFMDFSSPYMDFVGDDFLLIADDKEIAGKSDLGGLNSISLDTSDAHQVDVLNARDRGGTGVSGLCFVIPDVARSGECYNVCDKAHFVHDNSSSVLIPNISLSSASVASIASEARRRFRICTLNTEDWEIPCNADINLFPSSQVSPDSEQTCKESIASDSSIKIICNDKKAKLGESTAIVEEQVALSQPVVSPLEAGSSLLPTAGPLNLSNGCREKAELAESVLLPGFCRDNKVAVVRTQSLASKTVALKPAVAEMLKEEKIHDLGEHEYINTSIASFSEKSAQVLDNTKLFSANIANERRHDRKLQKHSLPHKEMISAEMGCSDSPINFLTSEQESQSSENENTVPNFSDIESMILDMDLDPYDPESHLVTKEVSKYHSADTRRAILRLERDAFSYMNKAMLSRGAFATFYGRRLKYFIKEPKVSLGRRTEEVEVDIDLGREGRANTISRLQAIIKLEEDGTFILRNAGKCSIFVNGKEVQTKKRTNLSSGSLIEIKSMHFVFVVNQSAVRRYLSTRRGSTRDQNIQFDWKPGSNP